MNHSETFIGHALNTDSTWQFILDARKSLKGTGFSISAFGRNPNRKQFYPEKDRRVKWGRFLRKSCFQQNLPRKFATSFALYLRASEALWSWETGYNSAKRTKSLKQAHKVVAGVLRGYKRMGRPVLS